MPNIRSVMLQDDTFTEERAREFCEAKIKAGINNMFFPSAYLYKPGKDGLSRQGLLILVLVVVLISFTIRGVLSDVKAATLGFAAVLFLLAAISLTAFFYGNMHKLTGIIIVVFALGSGAGAAGAKLIEKPFKIIATGFIIIAAVFIMYMLFYGDVLKPVNPVLMIVLTGVSGVFAGMGLAKITEQENQLHVLIAALSGAGLGAAIFTLLLFPLAGPVLGFAAAIGAGMLLLAVK